MSEESQFLTAIRANIDDDTPRLVYADWLEEHDQAARAEFIRVQCELAVTPEWDPRYRYLEDREHELLSQHEQDFLGPNWPEVRHWHQAPTEWTWRRGFVDEVSIDFGRLQHATYLSDHPIRSLHCYSDFGQPAELLACRDLWPLLEGVRSLRIDGWNNIDDQELIRLLNSDRVPQLCELNFGEYINHARACRILSQTPDLCKRLRALWVDGRLHRSDDGHTTRGVESPEVLTSHELSVIRQLEVGLELLSQCDVHQDLPLRLADWLRPGRPDRRVQLMLRANSRIQEFVQRPFNEFPRITTLSVNFAHQWSVCTGQFDHWEMLLHPAFQQLCDLELIEFNPPTELWSQLAEQPWTRQTLTRLRMHSVPINENTGQWLLKMAQLRQLELNLCSGSNSVWNLLANSGLPNQLTRLSLRFTGNLAGDVEHQPTIEHWPLLRDIHLDYSGVFRQLIGSNSLRESMPNLRQMVFREDDSRLNWIEVLEQCELSTLSVTLGSRANELLEQLAASPKLRRLNLIDLSQPMVDIHEDSLRRLAESPYLSPICEVCISQRYLTPGLIDIFRQRLGRRFEY